MIKYKCLSRNKDYSNKIDKELNNNINKFILMLRKGVCPYEYKNEWENFNETPLPEKEELYSNLNMEDITAADYIHAKKVCNDIEKKFR